MGPAPCTATRLSRQCTKLLSNCPKWLSAKSTSFQAVNQRPLQIVPSRASGVLVRSLPALHSCYSSRFSRVLGSLINSCSSSFGGEHSAGFSNQVKTKISTKQAAKKKGKDAVEAVAVEAEKDSESEAEQSETEDEESDENWEEGIAPLDEVEIPLEGEAEDGWEYEPEDEGPIEMGDGGDGGGIKVGSTFWGKKALEYAEEVLGYPEFAGKFKLYAFRAYDALEIVKVRLDKLEDAYGSPTMEEIQTFAKAFNLLLDEATERKELPIIETEVGSPGAERVVQVPQDLGRFQDLPMVVRFLAEKEVAEKKERKSKKPAASPFEDGSAEESSAGSELGSSLVDPSIAAVEEDQLEPGSREEETPKSEAELDASLVHPGLAAVEQDQLAPASRAEEKLVEHEEVLALESFDESNKVTVWKLADTRANRSSGKGRGLNRRQRDQRWHVFFSSLKLVRLYLEM